MNERELLLDAERKLSDKRYAHTIGVRDTAERLAERFGADPAEARTAAILHDILKEEQPKVLLDWLDKDEADERLFSYHAELWHGPAAAMYAREVHGIQSEDVLNAVRFHTTGRAGMSRLEKIVYLADLIEPSRAFPGVERLRGLVEVDLDGALFAAVANSIRYLIEKGAPVFPDSLACYNELAKLKGQ